MSKIVLFRPRAKLDAKGNLAGFVNSCRNELTVFGERLNFDENVWDITEDLAVKGHGRKRQRLVFSNLATLNERFVQPMLEPFLSFSKAYLRYMHGFRPTKAIAFRLTALRALEAALTEFGEIPDPIRIDTGVLNRAAQLVAANYTAATAYRIAGQLEMVVNFLTENKLTIIPVRWRNHLKRPVDTVRVGKEFDERRNSKLPSPAALDALPKIFRLSTEPTDVIISSVSAILCSSPDRISEVLHLPNNCEVHQSKGKEGGEAYGLRWWPAKGAEPMVKWIMPSMASVVKEAIEKIRVVTRPARNIAKWYENNPNDIFLETHLEYLRAQEYVFLGELAEILGFVDVGSAKAWCNLNKIMVVGDWGHQRVKFDDVQKTVIRMLPESFPIFDTNTGLKYSEALLIVRVNELHAQRGTYSCLIESVTINQVNTGMGSRAKHTFPSIFTRFGFAEPDGEPIKITTHQFRHYLNTLAQAGGLSQLDIAKWSGRKDIRQNSAYDHVTTDQMLQKIRNSIGDESQMFGPLSELPKKVLIPRDEFARLKVPTAHTTDFGFCIHDYTMSPCQLHMDCIHCEDLVCVKGDMEKVQQLQLRLDEARNLLKHAEQAVDEGYAGSDRWHIHHKSTVERLSQLCSIMNDPKVPLGTVIQLSPPRGEDKALGIMNGQLQITDDYGITTSLLTDVISSMEDRNGSETI